ncbi:MAG: PilZ domain-containing protein [bacterium]
MSKERRHFIRVDFQSSISVEIRGNLYQTELVDISLKGALIQTEKDIVVRDNETCIFELRLDSSTIAIKTDALIVYCYKNQLGLEFQHLDLESMTHLRRLIELNTGDADKVQQELFFLADSRHGD